MSDKKKESEKRFFALRNSGYKGPIDQDGNKVTKGVAYDMWKDSKGERRG